MISNPKNYRNLIVWQKSKILVLRIYHILKGFPKEEIYGLAAQMKRAAISCASNIAEGNQRKSAQDKIRFLGIAKGSLIELDCQLDLALELNFLNSKEYKEILEIINKTGHLLTRFIQSELDKKNPINPISPNISH